MHALRRWAAALAALFLILWAGAASATKICEYHKTAKWFFRFSPTISEDNQFYYGGKKEMDYLVGLIRAEYTRIAEEKKRGSLPTIICGRDQDVRVEYRQIINDYCKKSIDWATTAYLATTGYYIDPPTIALDNNGVRREIYTQSWLYELWELKDIYFTNHWNTGYYGRTVGQMVGSHRGPFAECYRGKSSIAFANGISTTQIVSIETLKKLKNEFNEKYNDTPLKYDLLYNKTSCREVAKGSCFADLAEVFAQRQTELNESVRDRWEFFWDVLSGRHQNPNSITGGIIESAGGIGSAFGKLMTGLDMALRNKAIQLTAALYQQPVDEDGILTHIRTLRENASSGISTTIVAHSQGNLFANILKYRVSATYYPPIYFVHVAPPTAKLNGGYVLTDIDVVINGIRNLIPGSVPAANVLTPNSLVDITGHGFLETYLDRSRPAYHMVRKLIADTLDAE